MSYYVDTVVTLHQTAIRSAALTALTEPLPLDGPLPQRLTKVDVGDAGGSKTFTGRVFAGALTVDIVRVADWFTQLPWDEFDAAALTATDDSRTVTVTVACGRAIRITSELDADDASTIIVEGPAGAPVATSSTLGV